jgi:hypothetical protein
VVGDGAETFARLSSVQVESLFETAFTADVRTEISLDRAFETTFTAAEIALFAEVIWALLATTADARLLTTVIAESTRLDTAAAATLAALATLCAFEANTEIASARVLSADRFNEIRPTSETNETWATDRAEI